MSQFINIDKTMIPYTLDIRLNNITYTMEFNYNSRHDFFTVGITTPDGTVLTSGEKLILDKGILSERPYVNFPLVKPVDNTGNAQRITWANFNKTIFLYTGGANE